MNTNLVHERLNRDLEFFAEHGPLYIKNVQGSLVPFRLNLAQRYIHDQLEKQKAQYGWVRALLLKGRQQGGSTYINARFFHQAVRTQGKRVFILSHEGKTTDSLFGMVERFYDNLNPALKPEVGKANTKQLTFPKLGAEYAAGTAGNEQVGRGGTAQLFHGSEAAYWEHAYAIQDGALKSIRLIAGTEVVLESTANGPTGLFYEMCDMALHGVGDFILIFVPWFWEPDYERDDDGSDLTDEEEEFAKAYFSKPFPYSVAPITCVQVRRKMLWRRAEIVTSGGRSGFEAGRAKFRRVYPSNPIEAFLSTAIGIMRSDAIEAARKNFALEDQFGARVAGVDPAGDGKKSDRTVIAIRQGRRLEKVLKFSKMKPMELVGRCARLIDEERLDMMFIDRGYGEGTIDRLHELKYGRKVIGVAFSESAMNELYVNKRSEIIIEMAKWVNEGGVAIPDGPELKLSETAFMCGGDEIHVDLAAMPLDKETSNGQKYMPPKEEIRKQLGRSPDIADAVALTFSFPVHREAEGGAGSWRKKTDVDAEREGRKGQGLRSLARKRALK